MRYILLSLIGAVAVAVIGIGAIAITLLGSGDSGTAQIQLDGVPLEKLESSGVYLSPPDGEAAPILSGPEAAQAAIAQVPPYPEGAVAKETVLVHLVQERFGGDLDTLAYVVNMEPASVLIQPDAGPIGADIDLSQLCRVPLFYVSFIDAYTGEWLFSQQASMPPENCPVSLGDGD